MKVGDLVPWPDDQPYDPQLVKLAMNARGKIERNAGRNRSTLKYNRARLIMSGHDDATHRATDPFELAKLFLGRKGYAVYRRSVMGLDGIQVGRRVMKCERDVMDYARGLGWNG